MIIQRHIYSEFRQLLNEYPVVTILGPRQAGKTTLAQILEGEYEYANLENPETRDFAETHPKAFLERFKGKVILDEIQRLPILLSYIQVIVDERKEEGHFILIGSHQLEFRQATTQSLAGRTGLLTLLPLSIAELDAAGLGSQSPWETIFKGFLPRIYDRKIRPSNAYANYYQTYVERAVRQLIHLKDAALFEKFMKLLAGRVGQLMDYTSLANDVGVSSQTIKSWLSILEASFIVIKLSPYYENFGKRLVKSPKYYFVDTGLLVFLLNLQNADQVSRDPLVGQIFENLVLEAFKTQYNKGVLPNLYFFRDSHGLEVDLVYEQARQLIPIEIKSTSTFNKSLLKGLNKFNTIAPFHKGYLAYSGDSHKINEQIDGLNFRDVSKIFN